MKKLWTQVKALEKDFDKVTYKNVPRAQNAEADKIVNEVLDSVQNLNA
jgi:ribonuclease HI